MLKKVIAIFLAAFTCIGLCSCAEKNDEKDVFATCVVGDIINFGEYELDGVSENGKETLTWKVLDIQHGKCLLLCQYLVEQRTYTQGNKSSKWESSELRKWLNADFYNNAFSDENKKCISETTIAGVDGAKNTTDKIFILSNDEVCKYMPVKDDQAAGAKYWCRSGGKVYYYIYAGGGTHTTGSFGDEKAGTLGVRPAIWVNIE